ncbi:MAG: hypothetical protein CMQ83_03210 [Gammaproteobacteria bacterium]|nr:hypothetical protein [Gammaproteobacteria bacterium]RCL41300.1 MAG: hypothetical protein DBW95_02380 [Gammaproteobacteria bacterium]|tara:strand:+ start:68 stop:952 length:885 start_codon:yes stop_codon:yes gene_type:complete
MEEKFQETTLRDIFKILNKEKIFIFLFTFFFTISSIIYVLFLQDIYKSETTLFPKEEDLPGVSSQIGSLANLAGININQEKNKLFVYIETLKSRKFHQHLLSFPGILENLMAPSSYDISSGELVFDSDLFDSSSEKWLPRKKPTPLEAHSFLLENLEIDREENTGIIKVSFKHLSPIFAKDFLDLVLNEFHKLTVEKDLAETENSIEYLNKKFLTSKVSSIKSLISSMMEEQLKKQMLIKFKEDYVFQIVDPPFTPEKKIEPLRSQIVIFCFLFGIFISISITLVRFLFISRNT